MCAEIFRTPPSILSIWIADQLFRDGFPGIADEGLALNRALGSTDGGGGERTENLAPGVTVGLAMGTIVRE
jgi:hypothetical protein